MLVATGSTNRFWRTGRQRKILIQSETNCQDGEPPAPAHTHTHTQTNIELFCGLVNWKPENVVIFVLFSFSIWMFQIKNRNKMVASVTSVFWHWIMHRYYFVYKYYRTSGSLSSFTRFVYSTILIILRCGRYTFLSSVWSVWLTQVMLYRSLMIN